MIPLLGELAEIIERRRQEQVEGCPFVFHRHGQRMKGFKQAWNTARKRAGLPQKLFHDTRRTAARNLDRAGVPRQVAKQIVGHKTDEMYNRASIMASATPFCFCTTQKHLTGERTRRSRA